jgi:hypothetical protein
MRVSEHPDDEELLPISTAKFLQHEYAQSTTSKELLEM